MNCLLSLRTTTTTGRLRPTSHQAHARYAPRGSPTTRRCGRPRSVGRGLQTTKPPGDPTGRVPRQPHRNAHQESTVFDDLLYSRYAADRRGPTKGSVFRRGAKRRRFLRSQGNPFRSGREPSERSGWHHPSRLRTPESRAGKPKKTVQPFCVADPLPEGVAG